jgi:hypothetical protein
MTNSKPFILSALLCLTFTVGMISYLLISDVPEKIRILNQKITASTYPQSRDVLNKDMAEIILPYLKSKKLLRRLRSKSKSQTKSIRRNNCSNQEATNEKNILNSLIFGIPLMVMVSTAAFLLTKSIDSPNFLMT